MTSFMSVPEPRSDAYTLLESSFLEAPKLKSHKPLPRKRDDFRSVFPAAEPLEQETQYSDDETLSQVSSQHHTPFASPGALNGADTGLPPTPPSNSLDQTSPANFSPPPYADGVVSSLLSKKSSLSTPINQRSPPTPDPSPPRTTESMTLPERPLIFTYPSSRAESFKTAREDQNSSEGSRSNTPCADRLSTVEENRGLGLAFERDDSDATPTNRMQNTLKEDVDELSAEQEKDERKEPLEVGNIPHREWDTNLMRNVTIRRKRNPRPQHKELDSKDTGSPAAGSTPRRPESLRERVVASKNSPHTPSIENFAHSIGWPNEVNTMLNEHLRDTDQKRLSGSSMTSTVVEAMVIVTPPQRRRTLRHTGKNLALRGDGDSFTDRSSATHSNRNSLNSEDVPLHRLVHKRASITERRRRISVESDTLANDRILSPLSVRKRSQDSAAATLMHQESVRKILQPAAEIMSRSNSLSRPYTPERTYHKRIASAPEPRKRIERSSPGPRTFLELSPPESPKAPPTLSMKVPRIEHTSPSTAGFKSQGPSPISPKVLTGKRISDDLRSPLNINKSLPDLPIQTTYDLLREEPPRYEEKQEEHQLPTSPVEPAKHQPAERELQSPNIEHQESLPKQRTPSLPNVEYQETPPKQRKPSLPNVENPETLPKQRTPSLGKRTPSAETASTVIRRGSLSARERSEERRRSSVSQDRTSTSRDTLLHPLDRIPTEELPRHSYESHLLHPDEHCRISFDRSTVRTEEHAMARHIYAQSTPFSQFSDTPDALEVSEATAISIYPHNNHSLLVVQQVARSSTLREQRQVANEPHISSDLPSSDFPSSPPTLHTYPQDLEQPHHPTLTFEPSTPPTQISLPVPGAVDSPLKNPRTAPEPPIIKFIPPTPAEELERELALSRPGPPVRSDSRPQRRFSLVQRARRYSDNLISPLLARATSNRGRAVSSHHENPHVPSVNDEDGSLHPFWRPRGFWEGFEDSDSDEEDVLPQGGDTSDVVDAEPAPRLGLGVLGRRLTNGFKGSGGFLIGNSLGVERAGTNKRRHYIDLPVDRRPSTSPKFLVQHPTIPKSRSPRVEKRGSRGSLAEYERPRRSSRRDAWRKGKMIPKLGVQVQYIGLSGVKERFREKRAEKRREEIRRSIGTRYFVEGGNTNVG